MNQAQTLVQVGFKCVTINAQQDQMCLKGWVAKHRLHVHLAMEDEVEINGRHQDLLFQDLAVQDLAVQDLAVQDLAVQDLAVQDLAVQDLAVQDLGVEKYCKVGMVGANVLFSAKVLLTCMMHNLYIVSYKLV